MRVLPEHRDPSQPPRRPRLRRTVWAVVGGAAAIVAMAIVAARWPPDWYADRVTVGDAAGADRAARRLVTTVAGLRSTGERAGAWGAAVREDEINAWLATDLPRNHAAVLPAGLTVPRVRFEPGRIRVAARAAAGPFVGLMSLDVGVRLRGVNQLECHVAAARFGALPLPPGPFAHRVAALLGRLGFTAELRRLDGRPVIVVSLGGRDIAVEGLTVNDGEIVIAGTTGARR